MLVQAASSCCAYLKLCIPYGTVWRGVCDHRTPYDGAAFPESSCWPCITTQGRPLHFSLMQMQLYSFSLLVHIVCLHL